MIQILNENLFCVICRHLYKRNADVEIPTNRQLSCLGENTLINKDELRFPLLKEDEDALEFISAVNKLLEEHLAEKTCTVKMLYLAMNMSRTSFYNKMINVTGHCPKRYMSLFKIEKAKQLLATRKHTMSEIAYMLGFCDSDYFRKQFKEICGVCPSEYNPDVIDKLVEQ